MLIRTIGKGGGVVFGGEFPGMVVVITTKGSRVRLGFQGHLDLPIINLKLLGKIICMELKNNLFHEERLALRSMLVLLEDPQSNTAEIIDLLAEPVFVELMYGPAPDEE